MSRNGQSHKKILQVWKMAYDCQIHSIAFDAIKNTDDENKEVSIQLLAVILCPTMGEHFAYPWRRSNIEGIKKCVEA